MTQLRGENLLYLKLLQNKGKGTAASVELDDNVEVNCFEYYVLIVSK